MKRQSINRRIFIISLLIVVIDQFSKEWVTENLYIDTTAPLIPGIIQLHLVKNHGAAFSLLSNTGPLLGLLSFLATIVISAWLWRSKPLAIWQGLGVGFLLGGTIGNGLDRWRLGYVIDFLDLIPIDFPIFNGADIAINLSVICFFIDLISRKYGHNYS